MPFFVGDSTQDNATLYFAAFILLKYSATKTQTLYRHLCSVPAWSQSLADALGIPVVEVVRTIEQVEHAFAELYSDDLVMRRGGHLYPKRLRDIPAGPEILFVRGDIRLLDEPIVSVVGTRNPSAEGRRDARDLAHRLTERHVVVASGLAYGIDEAAHEGALSAGCTVAVIGTPLNKVYPRDHRALQDTISETGVVLSQFLPSLPIQRWNFPLRNATMSGLSIATIVVEAGETSGALIQAREALKQGRRVFAPQKSVDNPHLKWPQNYVYRRGVHAFQDVDQLMQQLESADLIKSVADVRSRTAVEYVTGVQ